MSWRGTESGQLLLDLVRHADVAELALWINSFGDSVYRALWGDKDTYVLAFGVAGRAHEFNQLQVSLVVEVGGFGCLLLLVLQCLLAYSSHICVVISVLHLILAITACLVLCDNSPACRCHQPGRLRGGPRVCWSRQHKTRWTAGSWLAWCSTTRWGRRLSCTGGTGCVLTCGCKKRVHKWQLQLLLCWGCKMAFDTLSVSSQILVHVHAVPVHAVHVLPFMSIFMHPCLQDHEQVQLGWAAVADRPALSPTASTVSTLNDTPMCWLAGKATNRICMHQQAGCFDKQGVVLPPSACCVSPSRPRQPAVCASNQHTCAVLPCMHLQVAGLPLVTRLPRSHCGCACHLRSTCLSLYSRQPSAAKLVGSSTTTGLGHQKLVWSCKCWWRGTLD